MSRLYIKDKDIDSSRKMNTEKFGEFIRDIRKNKRLTQKEIADKLDVNTGTISKWEKGKYAPDIFKLVYLAEILGVSVYDLLCGEIIEKEDNVVQPDKVIRDNKLFVIFLILQFIVIVLLIGYIFLNSGSSWKVYSLKEFSDVIDFKGFVVVNENKLFLNLENLTYVGREVGTEDEMYVDDMKISLMSGKNIIFDNVITDDRKLIHEFLLKRNYSFEIKDETINIDDCHLMITFRDGEEVKDISIKVVFSLE